jgi:hypothetical protein
MAASFVCDVGLDRRIKIVSATLGRKIGAVEEVDYTAMAAWKAAASGRFLRAIVAM